MKFGENLKTHSGGGGGGGGGAARSGGIVETMEVDAADAGIRPNQDPKRPESSPKRAKTDGRK